MSEVTVKAERLFSHGAYRMGAGDIGQMSEGTARDLERAGFVKIRGDEEADAKSDQAAQDARAAKGDAMTSQPNEASGGTSAANTKANRPATDRAPKPAEAADAKTLDSKALSGAVNNKALPGAVNNK